MDMTSLGFPSKTLNIGLTRRPPLSVPSLFVLSFFLGFLPSFLPSFLDPRLGASFLCLGQGKKAWGSRGDAF